MSPARRALITSHWFREGPDPLAGYWICDFHGCGRHRSDHAQAEGDWRAPGHSFIPQRINPPRCYTCGYHRSQTRHLAWTWEQYGAALQEGVPAAGACAAGTENVVGQKECSEYARGK